jgi:carbon storage regulator
MLVLSRMTGESIEIDGGIVITVLKSSRGRTRIGIDAPKETRIRRIDDVRAKAEDGQDRNPAGPNAG